MDNQIKEHPEGTTHIFCVHFNPKTHEKVEQIVFLNEIANEVGYHGTCPICGSRHFAQANRT